MYKYIIKSAAFLFACVITLLCMEVALLFGFIVFGRPSWAVPEAHPLFGSVYRLRGEDMGWGKFNFWLGWQLWNSTVFHDSNPSLLSRDTEKPYAYITDEFGFIQNHGDSLNVVDIRSEIAKGKKLAIIHGGSTVAGYTTPPNHSISAYFERLCENCIVANSGDPGQTSRESLFKTAFHSLEFNPDVIIIFEGFNDFHRAAAFGRGHETWTKDKSLALNTYVHRWLLQRRIAGINDWISDAVYLVFDHSFYLYTSRLMYAAKDWPLFYWIRHRLVQSLVTPSKRQEHENRIERDHQPQKKAESFGKAPATGQVKT